MTKRKAQIAIDSRKTLLCRLYEKPEGCPYGSSCKFAHGKLEQEEGGENSIKKQREFVRKQCIKRDKNAHNNVVSTRAFVQRTGSMIDRYYTRMYSIEKQLFVHMHSNRLAVTGLAPGHPILTEDWIPYKVDFNVGKNDACLLEQEVRGKKKKGGMWFQVGVALCRIQCRKKKPEATTGTTVRDALLEEEKSKEFVITSCFRGRLYELNEQLLAHPEYLLERPTTNGHIAILAPKAHEIIEIQNQLSSTWSEDVSANETIEATEDVTSEGKKTHKEESVHVLCTSDIMSTIAAVTDTKEPLGSNQNSIV